MVERRMPAIVVEPCLTVFLDLLLIKRAGVRSGELPLKTYFSKALSLSILVSANNVVAEQTQTHHETVIVTANRIALTSDTAISSVVVFTEQDIKRSQARSLSGFLRGTSGLTVSTNGGRGSLSSMFLRGTNSDHVLVLVDGIKVGSATTGTASFDSYPLNQIERIEIVKGPRSSLYGSEAIGGIVQIFTKKGSDQTQYNASASVGTLGTHSLSADVSGRIDRLTYAVGVSGEKTQGYDSCDGAAATQFGGCFADEPDNDGYENLAGNVNLGFEISQDTNLQVLATESDEEVEFDGGSQNRSEKRVSVYGVGLSSNLSNQWSIDFNAAQSKDLSDNFKDDAFSTTFDTTRDAVSLFNDIQVLEHHNLLFGVDYLNDDVESTTAYAETSRENFGYVVQTFSELGKHDVEASVRYDENEQFGDAKTGSLGYGFQASDKLRFTVSHGTAFKAPSFNELYFPGFSNPNLEPERARSTELGMRWQEDSVRWSAAVYNTEVKNLIAFDSSFNPVNVSKATMRGIDVRVDTEFSKQFRASLDLGIVRALDASGGANDGNSLNRRPRSSAKVSVYYDQASWTHTGEFIVASGTYDDLSNNNKLDAYRVLNLRTEYAFSSEWSLGASLENAFDTRYQTARFYNAPERLAMLTLSYKN